MSSASWQPELPEEAPSPGSDHCFFAPCPKGLQEYLAAEIRNCDANVTQVRAAGVEFTGDLAQAYRVTLLTRIASRVLWRVESRRYRVDKDLYRIAARVPWHQYLGHEQTIRIDIRAVRSHLRSLKMAALRVKDAVVDNIREQTGQRPNVDTESPDVRIVIFLEDQQATLYLDLSGDNLFKRGWRQTDDKGSAPIKENLAAGLLAASGWNMTSPLFDPFCGSGTILIEAAQTVLGVAPQLRRQYGLQQLRTFDAKAWETACEQHDRALSLAGGTEPPGIFGGDIDKEIIDVAIRNSARAGVGQRGDGEAAIRFRAGNFADSPPPCKEPGWIVSNLPYGERMSFGGRGDVLGTIGRHLRQQYAGWTVCLLTSDLQLPGKLGLKPRRKIPLYNGTLDCRLFIFDIH